MESKAISLSRVRDSAMAFIAAQNHYLFLAAVAVIELEFSTL